MKKRKKTQQSNLVPSWSKPSTSSLLCLVSPQPHSCHPPCIPVHSTIPIKWIEIVQKSDQKMMMHYEYSILNPKHSENAYLIST